MTVNISTAFSVATLGASLMNDVLETGARRRALDSSLELSGLAVNSVYNRGQSGRDSLGLRNDIDGIISEIAANEPISRVIFMLHIGGNDVSNGNGYPSGAAELGENYRYIIEAIIAAGAICIPSPISYRIPPASNPTIEYNDNIIIPLIQELTPQFIVGTTPNFDMYNFTFDNQGLLRDGIHFSGAGLDLHVEYLSDVLSASINQTIAPKLLLDDVIVGVGSVTAGNLELPNRLDIGREIATNLRDTDGSILSDITLTLTGSHAATGGNTNSANTTYSLLNETLLISGLFVSNSNTMHVQVDGSSISPEEMYTIRANGARGGRTERQGLITAGGQSAGYFATVEDIAEINDVSGADLLADGILISTATGGTTPTAYLGGFQITRQASTEPAPTVTITDDATGIATGDVTYTFNFSEVVTGFTTSGIDVTGGTKGVLTNVSATEYTMVVSPPADSTTDITVQVLAGAAVNSAGTGNTASEIVIQEVDTTTPATEYQVVITGQGIPDGDYNVFLHYNDAKVFSGVETVTNDTFTVNLGQAVDAAGLQIKGDISDTLVPSLRGVAVGGFTEEV